MKKLLCLTLALALALTLLAGCSSASSSTPAQSTPADSTPAQSAPAADDTPADEPVTMKWAVWDIDATAYYQPLLDAYQEVAPNVTIEMVDLGSTDYQTVLATQLSGGADDLDIITVKDIPGYANLVNLGMLEPLNDYSTTDTSLYGGTVEQITVDGKMAIIEGVGKLKGAPVKALDLRAGAAMVIAGLIAEGTTQVENIQYIERGYETIVDKLASLGADIYYKSEPEREIAKLG